MNPYIVHVWSGNTEDADCNRRHSVVRKSWLREAAHYEAYNGIDLSGIGSVPRNALSIGDTVPLPFVHDLINEAFRQKADIVLLTNSDIGFYNGFMAEISSLCQKTGAAYCHRWDFASLPSILNTKEEVAKGKWYIGVDAVAVTREWWAAHKDKLPPFVFGRETWDWIFRVLIDETGGSQLQQGIYHEKHASAWKKGRLNQPGNVYNRSYARAWLKSRKLPLREIANAPFNEVAWPPVKWVDKTAAVIQTGPVADVLIVLGTGSKWGNTELRYCLRSLEKHAKNMGKVWVVGYNPGFLSKEVGFLEYPDGPHNKEAKIAEAILAACKQLKMADNFLWVNDDTFLIEDVDIASYPYYWDGPLSVKAHKTKPGGYKVALAQTDAQLKARRHTAHNFEMHVPILYNKQKFISLEPWIVISGKCPLGMTFRSIYCNVLGIPTGPAYKDNKISTAAIPEEMAAIVKGRHCFSIGDGISEEAKGYFHQLFPIPSKYES